MINTGAKKALSAKQHLYVIAGLSLFLLALFIFGNYSYTVEKWYTQGFYRFISYLTHWLLGWVPFSVGDILYTFIILYFIYFIVQLIRLVVSKKWRTLDLRALKLIIGIQVFIISFYLFWGLNYSRPPAADILNLPDDPYTLAQLSATTNLLIDSANTQRSILQPIDEQKDNSAIILSAEQAIKRLGKKHPVFQSYFPAAKPALFTPVLNYMGTAGYFNPFTGEAQVNYNMPLVNRPVTACHEMAHQMGFAREDEANFIGFVAGINSTDRLLKYSAYYMAMEEFLHQVRQRDTVLFQHLKERISVPVKQDMKTDRAYWLRYQNQIGYITGLFYDQFLKANKQPDGLRSYNRMINLTLAYYKKKTL
jgi:hypothetical protein